MTVKARVVQMSAKKIIKTHMEKNLPSCCVSSVDLDKHYTPLLSDATKYCFKPKFQNYKITIINFHDIMLFGILLSQGKQDLPIREENVHVTEFLLDLPLLTTV